VAMCRSAHEGVIADLNPMNIISVDKSFMRRPQFLQKHVDFLDGMSCAESVQVPVLMMGSVELRGF